MEGSAPTPVPASGKITGGSDILYREVVIYDLAELQGISATDASAWLDMKVGALTVNLSHLVATANYDRAKMAGAIISAGDVRGRILDGAIRAVAPHCVEALHGV